MNKILNLGTIFIFSLICGQAQAVSMDDPGIKRGVEIVPISRDDLSINRGTEIVPISLNDPSIKRGIELISISRDDPSINRGVEVVPISLDDPNINPGIEIVPISLNDPNINLGIAIVPISLNGPDIRRGIEIISMGGSDSVGEESDQDNEAGEQLTEEEILDLVNKAIEEMYSRGRESKLQKLSRRFFQREKEKIDIFNRRYENNKTILHLAVQKKSFRAVAAVVDSSFGLPEEEQIAFLNAKDEQGMTAFHYAVRSGHVRVVREGFIYSNRVNIFNFNAVDNYGRNAAHHAVSLDKKLRSGDRSAIEDMFFRLRLETEVDLTAQDNDGSNILHYAVKRGDLDIIEIAARYCKDIKTTDNRGRNPFHYIAEIEGEAGVQILTAMFLYFRFSDQEISDALGMFDKQGNSPLDIAKDNNIESAKLIYHWLYKDMQL